MTTDHLTEQERDWLHHANYVLDMPRLVSDRATVAALRQQLADAQESHAKTAKQFVDLSAFEGCQSIKLAAAEQRVAELEAELADERHAHRIAKVARLRGKLAECSTAYEKLAYDLAMGDVQRIAAEQRVAELEAELADERHAHRIAEGAWRGERDNCMSMRAAWNAAEQRVAELEAALPPAARRSGMSRLSLDDARQRGLSDACYVGHHRPFCLGVTCTCECHFCLQHGSRIPCPSFTHNAGSAGENGK